MDSHKTLSILLNKEYSAIIPIIEKLQCGHKVIINHHTITSLGLKTVCGKDLHFLRIELDGKFIGVVGV